MVSYRAAATKDVTGNGYGYVEFLARRTAELLPGGQHGREK